MENNNEMIEKLMQFYKENPSKYVHDLEMFYDSDSPSILPLRFPMSKIDEAFDEWPPSEIFKLVSCAHDDEGDTFNLNRKYFYFDDTLNLVSTDNVSCSDYLNAHAVSEIINNVSHDHLCEEAQAIIDKWSK
ncbi:MAG: hypothetical protein PUF17_08080 [Lactimicrobium massiliense]|nr:hypothetical protein [Lactimicrobium massiliense]MDD6560913.1 hypothetical protein [Lactimicrobium massiliense]